MGHLRLSPICIPERYPKGGSASPASLLRRVGPGGQHHGHHAQDIIQYTDYRDCFVDRGDCDIFKLSREEARLATERELTYIAQELDIISALNPDAQLLSLGTIAMLSCVTTHWRSPADNLRSKLQAVAEIAARLAWRQRQSQLGLGDVPLLAKAGDLAARIPRDQFLSQRTDETAKFKAALAELDLRWGYRQTEPHAPALRE